MSIAKMEREMVAEVRTFLNNPKVRVKDMLEWSTGETKPTTADELSFQLPRDAGYRYAGMWFTFPKALDKRPAAT